MAKAREHRWLTLGEAAARLGVDEATLRHWADTGRVRTFRTPGGHRRFLEQDLRALIQHEVPRVEDLAHLVERRSAKLLARSPAKPLRAFPWFAALDESLRLRSRHHGRQLFDAVVRYVAEPASRGAIRARACEHAQAYGLDLRRAGVRPTEAAEAFKHFRHLMLDTITKPRGRGGMLDEAQVRTLLEVSDLLDGVFAAMLRAWEEGRVAAPAGAGEILQ